MKKIIFLNVIGKGDGKARLSMIQSYFMLFGDVDIITSVHNLFKLEERSEVYLYNLDDLSYDPIKQLDLFNALAVKEIKVFSVSEPIINVNNNLPITKYNKYMFILNKLLK